MNRKDWTFVHEGPGDRTLSLNGYDILLSADKEQTELLTSNSLYVLPRHHVQGTTLSEHNLYVT